MEMTQEREAQILETAIEVYGERVQIDKAIEEMSELTKALLKHRRWLITGSLNGEKLKNAADAVLEEMADVSIMLNQLSLIFGDCNEQEIAKLERLEANVCKTNGAANV